MAARNSWVVPGGGDPPPRAQAIPLSCSDCGCAMGRAYVRFPVPVAATLVGAIVIRCRSCEARSVLGQKQGRER